jgi:hypothetical protein
LVLTIVDFNHVYTVPMLGTHKSITDRKFLFAVALGEGLTTDRKLLFTGPEGWGSGEGFSSGSGAIKRAMEPDKLGKQEEAN